MLTKRLEKKIDGNYTRMLRAILNKSWRQHPTIHQLYGHLPTFTKTIQVRRTRHAGQCWRSRDELISDELLWTPTYGRAKAGRPARTYIKQLCEDTGCSPEDLPEAMNDRKSGERGSGISVLAARHDDDGDDILSKLSVIGIIWLGEYLTRVQLFGMQRFPALRTGCITKVRDSIARRDRGFMSFLRVFAWSEMQTASSSIWTLVVDTII